MTPTDVLIFPHQISKGEAANITLYKTSITILNIASSSKAISLFRPEIFKKESVSNFLGHPVLYFSNFFSNEGNARCPNFIYRVYTYELMNFKNS